MSNKSSIMFIIPLFLAAMLLVACVPANEVQTVQNGTDNSTSAAGDVVIETPVVPSVPSTTTPDAKPATPGLAARYTVHGTEGDPIKLKPEAIDPDGDRITYSFTKPFDANGLWQTKIGDEGTYDIAVGANDGKSTTTEMVRVVVDRANRPPVIDCKNIVVNEGDVVDLHDKCQITDEDDTEVIVMYSGWMSSWRYQTTYDDAGKHDVTITASDKRKGQILHTVTKDVPIEVKNVNRAPVFTEKFPVLITGTENDVITLPSNFITDPDGDKVVVTYSAPFDKNGVWKTKIGDAGSYDVDVVGSDGQLSMKKTVTIKIGMLNTAPVLKFIPDITVKEGETVKLPVSAYDREGDKLTTTISGWMTGETYKTTYDDAGNYTVKIAVTDGVFNTSQIVHVNVIDVNRAPVFVSPA